MNLFSGHFHFKVVFIAARISYIRFFTAVLIYDFHTSTTKEVRLGMYYELIWFYQQSWWCESYIAEILKPRFRVSVHRLIRFTLTKSLVSHSLYGLILVDQTKKLILNLIMLEAKPFCTSFDFSSYPLCYYCNQNLNLKENCDLTIVFEQTKRTYYTTNF